MKHVFLTVISMLFLVVLMIYLLQRHLIYFPAKAMPTRHDFGATDMQEIYVTTSDGLHLLAWYKPAIKNKPTILYLHGNAGHIGYRMALVRQLITEGFGVLLLEYRGYGGNEGSPSEQGFYLDAQAAMKFLHQQGLKKNNLAIYGESLGTGVATQLAAQNPVCAVILQSPFTSLVALAQIHYPWIMLKPWDKFNSLDRIKLINAPLLILHGTKDTIVPYQQGLMLYDEANKPKKWVELRDGGHNALWNAKFYHHVIQFIHEHCVDHYV